MTVGSSPLPVVVSVLYLKPARIFLVYTPDVSRVVNRVCEHLGRKLPGCERNLVESPDHRSAARIHARLEDLKGSCSSSELNYTGGTKLMAVHTHRFWMEHGGNPRDASYLGADGRLYFDDPSVDPVREADLPHLSLDELCSLHFGKIPGEKADGHKDRKQLELATRICDFIRRHGHAHYRNLLKPIHHASTVDLEPLFQGMEVTGLNIKAVDLDGFSRWFLGQTYERMGPKESKKAQVDCGQWLIGGWLEVWFADHLARVTPHTRQALFDEVHQHVRVGTKPDAFEMDVVAVHGYRVFLFSCTVDDKRSLVKAKLFEAANRADRIGGEHARAAVVCLYDSPHEVLQTVQEEHWPGYDTLRLFGKPHVEGAKAPCQVPTGDDPPPDVTLLDGIRQWVAT